MFKKIIFLFFISLLLSISALKAVGEPVIESVSGSVTITKGSITIPIEIPKTQGWVLDYKMPLVNLETGEYTITEKYTIKLVNQTEEKLEFKSWQYEVKEPGKHQWSVSSSIINPVNISSWMWLKVSVMSQVKNYSDNDKSYAKAHIGGRKRDAQTAFMNLPRGMPLSIDITGDIGGSVQLSKDTTVQQKLDIPIQTNTNKLKDDAMVVPIEKPGTYDIQERMLLTIRSLGIGEVLGLKFDFPVMVPWKYETEEAGNRNFHLTGSVANVFLEVKGDLEAKKDEPDPQISQKNPVQLPITVTKDIRIGETYKYSMDFSATWTKESWIEPVPCIDVEVSAPKGAVDKTVSTNQIFTVTAIVTCKEIGILKLDGGGTYKLVEGEFENKPFGIKIPVTWKVQAPEKRTPPEGAKITVSIVDTTISNYINVITVTKGTLKIEGFSIVEPSGAQDNEVSTDQEFTVQAKVITEGEAKVNEQKATLDPPSGFGVKENITLPVPEKNEPEKEIEKGIVKWTITAPKFETTSDFIITAEGIEENLYDDDKTTTVDIVKAPDEKLTVTVVSKADLSVKITEPKVKGLFATEQAFIVTAEVINNGKAGVIGKGSLKIDLGEKEEKEFELGKSEKVSVSWNLKAPSNPQSTKPITVSFGTIPLDENSGEPAKVSKPSDQTQIEIIQPLPITITAPDGAKDGVVSTGQSFTVKAENIPSDVTKATIYLPAGYRTDKQTKKPEQGIVTWEITAPPEASSPASITADFEREELIPLPSQPLTIETVTAATLSLTSAKITSPESAIKGTVYIKQKFTVTAYLKKDGEAQLIGPGELSIDLPDDPSIALPDDYHIVSDTAGNFYFKEGETEKTVSWEVEAPATAREKPENIMVEIKLAPSDKNTNAPATTPVKSANVPVITVPVEPRFEVSIKEPKGAVDGKVSTGYDFVVENVVFIPEDLKKDVKAGDSTIEVPTGYQVTGGETQNVPKNGIVEWTVTAPQNPASKQDITVTTKIEGFPSKTLLSDSILIETVKRASLEVKATISAPPGATDKILSTGQEFDVQATLINKGKAGLEGSGQLSITVPQGYSLWSEKERSFTDKKTETVTFTKNLEPITWKVQAPSDATDQPADITVKIDRAPDDENTNQPAEIIPPGYDTLIIERVDKAAELEVSLEILEPESAKEGSLLTDQIFTFAATVKNNGQAQVDDTGRLLLGELPTGYKLIEGAKERPFTTKPGEKIEWKIQASGIEDKTPQQIEVSISNIPNDLNTNKPAAVKRSTAGIAVITVPVEPRFEVSIKEPKGAVDGKVSTGYDFVVENVVFIPEDLKKDVKAGDSTIEVPTGYQVTGGETQNVPKNGIVEWTVTAPQNPASKQDITVTTKIEGFPSKTLLSDSILIETVKRASLEVEAKISYPPGAEDKILSTGQEFDVQATLINKGKAGLEGSGQLSITVPQGYIPLRDENQSFDNKLLPVTWKVQAPKDATDQPANITVKIDRAPDDENTNKPAEIIPPGYDTLIIERVDKAAELEVSLEILEPESAKEGFLLTDQIFTIAATVKNNGQAQVDSTGRLLLGKLPNGYELIKGEKERDFMPEEQIKWDIQAPEIEDTKPQQIEVSIANIPNDENTNKPADVKDNRSTVGIAVITKEALLQNEILLPPINANPPDNEGIITLSTEQEFILKVKVTASKNVRDIQSKLKVPKGYKIDGESVSELTKDVPVPVVKEKIEEIVEWEIEAPPGEAIEPQGISVTSYGTKTETKKPIDTEQQPATVKATVKVRTEARAELSVKEVEIIKYGGPKGTVSTEQSFTVRATLEKTGTAELKEAGEVFLEELEAGKVLPEEKRSYTTNPRQDIAPFEKSKDISWQITAPKTPLERILKVTITKRPTDENTNKPADIKEKPADIKEKEEQISVKTVEKAGIVIKSFTIIAPPGATDKTVSTGQEFTMEATVVFEGEAKVMDPEATLTPLNLPLKSVLDEKEQKQDVKTDPEVKTGSVQWKVKAPEEAVDEVQFQIIVTGADENSGWPLTAEKTERVKTVEEAKIKVEDILVNVKDATELRTSANLGQTLIVTVNLTNVGQGNKEKSKIATANLTFLVEDISITRAGAEVSREYLINAPPQKQISGLASEVIRYELTPTQQQKTGYIRINLRSNRPEATDENSGNDVSDPESYKKDASILIVEGAFLVIDPLEPNKPHLIKEGSLELLAPIRNQGGAETEVKPSNKDLIIQNDRTKESITDDFNISAEPELIKLEGNNKGEIRYTIKPGPKVEEEQQVNILFAKGMPMAKDLNDPNATVEIRYPGAASVRVDPVPPHITSAVIDGDANQIVLTLTFSEPLSTKPEATQNALDLLVDKDNLGTGVSFKTEGNQIRIKLGSNYKLQKIDETYNRLSRTPDNPSGIDVSEKTNLKDLAGNPAVPVGGIDIDFIDEQPPTIEHEHLLPVSSKEKPRVYNPYAKPVSARPVISAWISDQGSLINSGIDKETISISINGKNLDKPINYKSENMEKEKLFENLSQTRLSKNIEVTRVTAKYPSDQPPLPGGKYTVLITVNDNKGNHAEKEFSIYVESKTGILSFASYPNPFEPGKDEKVTFVYQINASSEATLNIYTISGELVFSESLNSSKKVTSSAEGYRFAWDGTVLGEKVPTGVYFCELVVKSEGKEYRKYWRMVCRPARKKK